MNSKLIIYESFELSKKTYEKVDTHLLIETVNTKRKFSVFVEKMSGYTLQMTKKYKCIH